MRSQSRPMLASQSVKIKFERKVVPDTQRYDWAGHSQLDDERVFAALVCRGPSSPFPLDRQRGERVHRQRGVEKLLNKKG